jgi:hypothetical protein
LQCSNSIKAALISNRFLALRKRKYRFLRSNLGRQISGTYAILGRMLTVVSPDGRQNSAPLGGGSPEILARLTLIQLEAGTADRRSRLLEA